MTTFHAVHARAKVKLRLPLALGVGRRSRGEAEFFVDFADAFRNGLACVVVPADGAVGVVGTVEGIAPWCFLLQQDASVGGSD